MKQLININLPLDWSLNGKPHYERAILDDSKVRKIHLYWSGTQWILHFDLDPSRNFDNLLAYAKVKENDPRRTTSYWYVKVGNSYEPSPDLMIAKPGIAEKMEENKRKSGEKTDKTVSQLPVEELFGIPKVLLPFYFALMLDAIAVGITMPLLPFYIIELGADAFQLSLVVSSNYVAQTIGCLVMGRISDSFGRKVVLITCLLASTISYFSVSHSKTILALALSRIISGSFGGLVPVLQSSVADVAPLEERPKYIGRIMACYGLGFVLGPAISVLIAKLPTNLKIRLASILPLIGLVSAILFAKEPKKNVRGLFTKKTTTKNKSTAKIVKKEESPIELEVMLLVLNGFLTMYAFATETIYAMFIKDSFGYGHQVLSSIFAANGLLIGIFQVFLIKPMISKIGKHATLMIGNALLAIGLVGIALVRKEVPHFALFGLHIIGYSIADTSLVSLVSRYSSPSSQGRDLALNSAAQSCARVISPLLAGFLYEQSKSSGLLPVGASPFLVAALCPAIALSVTTLLYIRSVGKKRKNSESLADKKES